MSNHEIFMDRFVDWHVQIMTTEPFDILANASWLPDALMTEYDTSLDRAANPEGRRRGAQARHRHRDQRELQAAPAGVPQAGQGRRREVQLRLQRPLSQHGQARLQHRHGQDTRAQGQADMFVPGETSQKAVRAARA